MNFSNRRISARSVSLVDWFDSLHWWCSDWLVLCFYRWRFQQGTRCRSCKCRRNRCKNQPRRIREKGFMFHVVVYVTLCIDGWYYIARLAGGNDFGGSGEHHSLATTFGWEGGNQCRDNLFSNYRFLNILLCFVGGGLGFRFDLK